MRRPLPALVLLAAALAGCGTSGETRRDEPQGLAKDGASPGDRDSGGRLWGRDAERREELDLPLPPAPREDNLVTVRLRDFSSGTIRIDRSTLRSEADLVVRYVVVVTAPGGARNVSYEAVRCDPNEGKRYAIGRADGSWSVMPDARWEPVKNITYNAVQFSLAKDYFCASSGATRSAREILALMERELRSPSKPVYN